MRLRTIATMLVVALSLLSVQVGQPLSSPTAAAASVSTAHPRIWLTADRLAVLKNYAARNNGTGTTRWQKLKAVADDSIGARSVYMGDTDRILALCLAYQVNGSATYAQAGIALLKSTAVPTNTLTSDSYYNYRSIIPNVSAGYDWCYDQMTVAERQQVATWLMDRADQVWPDSNPARVGGWAVNNPANNYFYGFLMTWVAALAVNGDSTDTGTGAISGSNRPAYHLALAREKYNSKVKPWATSLGSGGVFAESTNYDSASRLGIILDAHLTATGEDLINDPTNPFLKESIYWRIASTVPTKNFYYSLGDQPRISSGPLSDYDRMRAFVPATKVNDPLTRQYAKYWLDTLTPNISSWGFQVGWEFLYYDEDAPSRNYTTELPTSFLAPGSGMFTKRSSWANSATYWGVWSGPLREGHQDRNVNGFLIWKGSDWLVGNGTMYSASGLEAHSIWQNNYTFGAYAVPENKYYTPQTDAGQGIQTPNAFWPNEAGAVLRTEDAGAYTLFVGQGAQAYTQDRSHDGYNNHQQVATDYARKLLYLPGSDTFLIFDRVSLVDATKPKDFHLQSKNPITVNGRQYSWSNGGYTLSGTSMLPLDETTVRSVPAPLGSSGATSSYRLDISTSGNRVTDYLLNILQVTPTGTAPSSQPSTLANLDGAVVGTQIGSQVVLFGKTEQTTSTFSYSFTSTSQTDHFITDLAPQQTYTINDSTGRSIEGTASAQGTLHFTVPAGGASTTVTLAPKAEQSTASVVLAGTADRLIALPGSQVSYSITYENTGSSPATNVRVSDFIPNGSTYLVDSATPTAVAAFDALQRKLTWNIGSVPAGGKGILTFTVTVD